MSALEIGSRAKAAVTGDLYIFAVRAVPDPQAMLRIAGLFAQRNIVPHQLCSRISGPYLVIDIEIALDEPRVAPLMLEKIRSMVCVERVSLVERKN